MSGFGLKTSVLALVCASGLMATAAFAQNNSSPVPGLKLSGDQPIQIESDKLEVDETQSKATFSGNVSVLQGETLLKAGRMVVFYKADQKGGSASPTTGSSAIDRLEVDGKVYVKSGTQVGTGDKGTFNMESGILVLSGKEVVLSDGGNILKGCKLTVDTRAGKSAVDGNCGGGTVGRVKSVFTPGSQSNAAEPANSGTQSN